MTTAESLLIAAIIAALGLYAAPDLVALKNSYHGHACDPGICDASDKCHCGRDAAIAKAEAMLK